MTLHEERIHKAAVKLAKAYIRHGKALDTEIHALVKAVVKKYPEMDKG